MSEQKTGLSKYAYINLVHLVVVVPLLIYVYYKAINKELNSTICTPFLAIGILGIIYHAFLCSNKVDENKETWRCWVNHIHMFLVFPLFIYIGYYCENTERKYFEMLLLLAIASFGYHARNLIVYG